MELFGPQEDEDYYKACNLILVTTPSALCRKIIALLCEHRTKPLESCCCKKSVSGIWRSKLPQEVLNGIAGKSLGSGNLEQVLRDADAVYKAFRGPSRLPAVTQPPAAVKSGQKVKSATAVAASAAPALSPETEDPLQVAAIGNRGRGSNRRGRGYTRGGQSQGRGGRQSSSQPIPPHPDGPPETACRQHLLYGKQAHYCTDRTTCPWRDIISPRPKK